MRDAAAPRPGARPAPRRRLPPWTRLVAAACVAAALAPPAAAAGQPLGEVFRRATEAAARGDHEAALAGYDQLIEAGVTDADVFFDRATVLARQRRYGAAIRDFRAALALRPGDDGARAGLDRAQEALAERRAERDGEAVVGAETSPLRAFVAPLPEPTLAWLVLALDVAFCLALGGLWWVRREVPRAALGVAAGLLGLALAASGAALAVRRGVFRDGPAAVVLADAALLEGPVEGAEVRRRVDEGTTATVLDVRGGHARVRVGGDEGWVEVSDVGIVGE